MSSLKRKGTHESASGRVSSSAPKRRGSGPRTRGGSSGPSGSPQPSPTASPDVYKFRPHSEAESRFHRSFHSRPVFISRGVLLSDFSDTMIFSYFHDWGWDHMAVPAGSVCNELVREFYVNIHATDKETGFLKSYVRGKFLDFSIETICSLLHIPVIDANMVGFPYPEPSSGPSLNSVAQLVLTHARDWTSGSLLKQKDLKDIFRVLNLIICDLFQCTTHVSEIDETRARLMHAIASNLPIDLGRLMFNLILEASLDNSSRAFLPFGLLITDFLRSQSIEPEPHESHLPTTQPISRKTLRLSNAQLGVAQTPSQNIPPVEETAPPDNVRLSPISTGSSASDPSIAAAVSALIAHMDGIHKDLVERISLVHERVDRVVERQELDIKAVRDTLSALSQRHNEFISEVNEFIRSIGRR